MWRALEVHEVFTEIGWDSNASSWRPRWRWRSLRGHLRYPLQKRL